MYLSLSANGSADRFTIHGFGRSLFSEPTTRIKTVRVSSGSYTKDWVCRYYAAILDQTLTDAGLAGYTIDWEIDGSADEKQDDDTELFFETKPRTITTPGVINYADVEGVDTSLNPKYTFEKFVVGIKQPVCPRGRTRSLRDAWDDLQSAFSSMAVSVWAKRT